MPGRDDREPADANRPPASRVGDELQERVDDLTEGGREPSQEEMARAEREAEDSAEEIQWDQASTNREREAS
jgi:hypothetical protein